MKHKLHTTLRTIVFRTCGNNENDDKRVSPRHSSTLKTVERFASLSSVLNCCMRVSLSAQFQGTSMLQLLSLLNVHMSNIRKHVQSEMLQWRSRVDKTAYLNAEAPAIAPILLTLSCHTLPQHNIIKSARCSWDCWVGKCEPPKHRRPNEEKNSIAGHPLFAPTPDL
eukprot:2488504-Amphidinium_carterae.1